MSKVTAPPKVTLIFYPSILNPESNGYAESSDPYGNGGPLKKKEEEEVVVRDAAILFQT